ncbi:MAG: TatD family hydrolase [Anaerolineales bacterium]|nr:TatD family hydrolase [Anaerolineales bacterium]
MPFDEPQPTIRFTDTHCHLDFDLFEKDRVEVVQSARASGVHWIVNPAVDVPSSQVIVKLTENLEGVYAAVGVHPNDSTSWDENSLTQLKQLAVHPKVVAIGEIGLDYYRDRAPRDVQLAVFCEQLQLAQDAELPVIIHTRQSIADTLDILKDWISAQRVYNHPLAGHPGVLHSFSGTETDAWRAIELGFFIGITGPVTFKNAPDLQKLVASLPLDRILIETDAPFLAPLPHRGQRNCPEWVRLVAEKIAELQQTSLEETAKITTANAQRLFAWRDRG